MIIFLDIDGVLNTNWTKKWNKKCILELNRLVESINIQYVITSSWRIIHSIDELSEIFNRQGINGVIIGYTDVLVEDRGLEIITYINFNNITDYIVIDDKISDIIGYIERSKIYHCDSSKGITKKMIDDILKEYHINNKGF